jgi:hypothetical protein
LVLQTEQLLQADINWYLAAFVFCATMASYNFHYILAGAISKQKLSLSLFTNRPSATGCLIAGITGAVLFFLPAGISLWHAALALLLTATYSVPLLPFKQLDVARKAGMLKTVLLAFTWMYVTAYIPMAEWGLQWSSLGLLVLAKRFLFMLMLCIIFDNRDVAVDTINGLHSLATDLPPKMLQAVVFIFLFVLNFFLGQYGVDARKVAALQLSAFITLLVYFLSRKKQGYLFYYFVVDGMMILMTALTTIASI